MCMLDDHSELPEKRTMSVCHVPIITQRVGTWNKRDRRVLFACLNFTGDPIAIANFGAKKFANVMRNNLVVVRTIIDNHDCMREPSYAHENRS